MVILDEELRAQYYKTYVKPAVYDLLHSGKLDIEYYKAEGDYLFYKNKEGQEIKVLDMVGGYGASLLGHNHPQLALIAQEIIADKRPFNAQGSIRGYAAMLAQNLSKLVGKFTGKSYYVNFANSGAEAVEAALKHAEFVRLKEYDDFSNMVLHQIIELKKIWHSGKLNNLAQLTKKLSEDLKIPQTHNLDDILNFIQQHNENVFLKQPKWIALKNSYHGKTLGALQVTYRHEFRSVWHRLMNCVHFIEPGNLDALERLIELETQYFFTLDISDETVCLKKYPFINISACIVEPIQGEGGIVEMNSSYMQGLRYLLTQSNIPLIIDEIQTGMGRSGTFLASETLGIKAEYYLFSKSLGGGLSKISATLIDSGIYQSEFGMLHTSTFADDDFSSRIGLEVLELITENDNEFIKNCAKKGSYLLEGLIDLQKAYPTIIDTIRGRGLMIGIALKKEFNASSEFLKIAVDQSLLGYLICGYLLNKAQIRVAPVLNSNFVIRLEPSGYITQNEMDYFLEKMKEVCQLIVNQDIVSLICHSAVTF